MNPAVLFVDDEKSICSALDRTFKKNHFKVFKAYSGKQALTLLNDNRIDVVVSDQRMPGMSGTQLLKIVKERYPEIGRIILSGESDVNDLTEAINEANIYQFVPKPWNDTQLLESVNRALPKKNISSLQRLQALSKTREKTSDQLFLPLQHGLDNRQIELEEGIKNSSLKLKTHTYCKGEDSTNQLNYIHIEWPSHSPQNHDVLIDLAKQSGYLDKLFTWYLINIIDHINEPEYSNKTLVVDIFSDTFISNYSLQKLLLSLLNCHPNLLLRIPFRALEREGFMESLPENASFLLNIGHRIIDIRELESTSINYLEIKSDQGTVINPLLVATQQKMARDAKRLEIKTILSREDNSDRKHSEYKDFDFC